jgi:SpoVK/Ycf46/Vps4 family AAA+-type ATPase
MSNVSLNSSPNALYNRFEYEPMFRGTLDKLPQELNKISRSIPLNHKLASLVETAYADDVILAGNNLIDARKMLIDSVKSFTNPIKKVFFIEDKNIQGAIAISRDKFNLPNIVNLAKKELKLTTNSGNTKILKKGDGYPIQDKTGVEGLGMKFTYTTDIPKLDSQRMVFSKSFDFTKDTLKDIETLNEKTLKRWTTSKKIPAKPITFADVGGQEKVINQIKKEFLYPIKYPAAYKNVKVNHGVILYGPPGTGKSLIAEALANEGGANFIKLNGKELESKWVGETEENWRKLFKTATDNQPSIIVIDEFDCIARKRGGANVYSDDTVDQLLTLMSDVEKNGDEVYVVGATNRIGDIDEAVKRAGRFTRHIEVPAPDLSGVKQIFNIHLKGLPLSKDIDKDALSKAMYAKQATGSDIPYIVTAAHSNALERYGNFNKMENNTFTDSDMDNFELTNEDFFKGIDEILSSKDKKPTKIGYTN